MPHPYWLQNAIRRNPRSTGPNRSRRLPNLAKPQIVTAVHTKPQRKRRPIRRKAPYWAIGRKPAMDWLEQNGFPEPGDGGQAKLERYVADVLGAWGHHPAESTIRAYVRKWIDEYRARVKNGSPRGAAPKLLIE
jgi:hypothetical protein